MSTLKVNNVTNLTGLVTGLGYDQTWQDVTTSRFANIEYTNNTGKPIQILVQTGTSGLVISLGNNVSTTSTAAVTNGYYFTQLIIPVGGKYTLSLTPVKWLELR